MGNCIRHIFKEKIVFDPLDNDDTSLNTSDMYTSAYSSLSNSELSQSFVQSLQKADTILSDDF